MLYLLSGCYCFLGVTVSWDLIHSYLVAILLLSGVKSYVYSITLCGGRYIHGVIDSLRQDVL